MIRTLFLLIVILSCGINGYTQFIGNIFTKGVKNSYVFVVDKSEKKLEVVRIYNDEMNIVRVYNNILLGEVKGDKQKEGDKRTPEGIYKILSFIPPSNLSSIYGDGAYPLNYPNPIDKIFGKTGYGIWIHGLDVNRSKLYTQGCVGLHNGDLKDFSRFRPIGKDVIISNHVEYLDATDYISKKSYWINYMESYLTAWENNNFEKFSSFYHILFKNNKREDLKKYLLNKKRLMKIYPYKRINFDNLKILVDDNKKAYVSFRQLYCAPNIINEGYKYLYLYNDTGKFQIMYESYKPLNDYALLKSFIESFINKWKISWENKDIDRYMAFYSHKFNNKGYDWDGWKDYKKRVFEKHKNISLEISNLKFKIINPLSIEVIFNQKYFSDSYKDYGVKKLILKGCPGDYKIYRESWRKLK